MKKNCQMTLMDLNKKRISSLYIEDTRMIEGGKIKIVIRSLTFCKPFNKR